MCDRNKFNVWDSHKSSLLWFGVWECSVFINLKIMSSTNHILAFYDSIFHIIITPKGAIFLLFSFQPFTHKAQAWHSESFQLDILFVKFIKGSFIFIKTEKFEKVIKNKICHLVFKSHETTEEEKTFVWWKI